MTNKYVYLFSEGNANMRNLLGGKGANLAEMTNIGLPVPQGFTVTTEACTKYYDDGKKLSQEVIDQILEGLKKIEKLDNKKFGDKTNPLLVSVRSGARASMPGMMDTVLNLGLNDEVVEGLANLTNNPRFAYDSYRRFIQMFSDVVMGLDKSKFENNNKETSKPIYPLAIHASGHDEVFVGRIRRDFSVKSGINLWVVADNIRKGAATNAVQIVEKMLS